MRLVKTAERRQAIVGQDAFDQLRDLGGRLDYLVRRYGRLVMDVADGRPLPDLRESVELMNGQLGYVARRLQDLLVAQYEDRLDACDSDRAAAFSGEIAAAQ
jgi:hypothetical protein